MPVVHESQKLVIARLVRELSDHTVAIRSLRDDILHAVKRDFGLRFTYWKLGEADLPADRLEGIAYIVADDALLPTSDDGENVRVPLDTKLKAVASSSDVVVDVPEGVLTEGEKRGEGRSAMPLAFV